MTTKFFLRHSTSMKYILALSILLILYLLSNAETCTAPWADLGAQSFDETSIAYVSASWPMPKDVFRTDWDPSLVEADGSKLSLSVEKRADGTLMGAEIRTASHYGYGCVSACMKPIKESGVISSLFTYTGKYDGYKGIDAKHNEIDIEFQGRDTTKVQFNYYADNINNDQRNEFNLALGFDAATGFNVYGFRWTPLGVEWEVNGKVVKSVGRDAIVKPPVATKEALQKVLANAWIVSPEIESSFGGTFNVNSFTRKTAEYLWIRYEKLDTHGQCSIATSC